MGDDFVCMGSQDRSCSNRMAYFPVTGSLSSPCVVLEFLFRLYCSMARFTISDIVVDVLFIEVCRGVSLLFSHILSYFLPARTCVMSCWVVVVAFDAFGFFACALVGCVFVAGAFSA